MSHRTNLAAMLMQFEWSKNPTALHLSPPPWQPVVAVWWTLTATLMLMPLRMAMKWTTLLRNGLAACPHARHKAVIMSEKESASGSVSMRDPVRMKVWGIVVFPSVGPAQQPEMGISKLWSNNRQLGVPPGKR